MADITISRDEYRDKVYACWLGKNIGGTLGTPDEGKKYPHSLTFYDPVPDGNAPNDDLDLQLVWLVMLEREGLPPRLPHFAGYWRQYLHKYPWNEYGFCNRNLQRGLMPPVSGWFENYFVDEMGSPIRSEIWACLSPGDPQTAASLAWMDSAMDHAGGEGTYGEMFWAAVESAAFVLADPVELIRVGLVMIPPACNISRVIREALWCWQHGVRYDDARERITRIYWHEQPCNAIPNHGFTVLGWLYGEGFGDSLCRAVNCGFDTDCTGATLGSLLGILGGTRAIPAKWSEPIGTNIVLHEFTVDCGVPKSLDELTERTVRLAEEFVRTQCGNVAFGEEASRPRDLVAVLQRNEKAFAALQQDIRCGVALAGDLEIALHYHGDPVLYPGTAKRLRVTCRRDGAEIEADISLEGPPDCRIQPVSEGGRRAFLVTAPVVDHAVTLEVTAAVKRDKHTASFAILSPNDAQGYPNAVPSTQWRPGMTVRSTSPRHPGISFKEKPEA